MKSLRYFVISLWGKNSSLPISLKITARADQKNEGIMGSASLPILQEEYSHNLVVPAPRAHQSYREDGHAPRALLAQAHNSTLR